MAQPAENTNSSPFPNLGVFAAVFGAWCVFFHFVGNSSFGYVNSHSFFGWLVGWYGLATIAESGDELCPYIPFLVGILLWIRRAEIAAAPKRTWLGGLVLIAIGVAIHVAAFLVQQVRISGFAFLVGGAGIIASIWGPQLLRVIAFPWFLLMFSVPLDAYTNSATFPLRLLSTTLSAGFCRNILALKVVQSGTTVILPPSNHSDGFQFDVVAACSGIRSASVILLIALVYAYLYLHTNYARIIMVLSSVPLAVLGNVVRLVVVFMVGDAFGQQAATVIESRFGFITYAAALVGVMALGHLLARKRPAPDSVPGGEQPTLKSAV